MSVVSLVNSEKVRQGSEDEPSTSGTCEVWHDGAATTRRAPAPTPEAEYGKPRQICQMAEDYKSLFSGWPRKIHFFGLYFWLKYGISLVWSTSTGCPATIPATNG